MSHSPHNVGGWLPADASARHAFRKRILEQAQKAPPGLENPAVYDFHRLILSVPTLRMGLAEAISQADFAGHDPGFSSLDEMIAMMQQIVVSAPQWNDTALVGAPLNALFDPLMNVAAGYAVFRDPRVNAALKTVLQSWCGFLSSSASTTYLNEDPPSGWFCPDALNQIDMDLFQCDPEKPHWGFASWNDYFIRLFKPGKRPVHDPGNVKSVVNACESAPYALRHDVQAEDTFWVKEQNYALRDMLGPGNQRAADYYVGGTVYQAFLSAHNYHRWNAPVIGTVVAAYTLDGTYYSDLEAEGYDPAGPNLSQGYLSSVAARAVVAIDTGDAQLGIVTCIFIGMAEISSNIVTVRVGDKLKKGDQLGYFQYGGSTHCLLFQKGAIKTWHLPDPPFDFNAKPLHLSAKLAEAH